jgi:hypothetical protein
MTLILVAKEYEKGRPQQVLDPHYVRFRVPQDVIDQAGGWQRLMSLKGTAPVSCYLTGSSKPLDATLCQLILPSSRTHGGKDRKRLSRGIQTTTRAG